MDSSNELTTTAEARREWLALRDEYAAAIDRWGWGWDDPRTIELEAREAIASDAWLMVNQVG